MALASTGVSGIPVAAMLEARGFQVYLVHARHSTQVPVRQSAMQDGQRLQSWHTCGLLSGSCRPAAELAAWRAYLRHRATWLEPRAAPIQHLQKALPPMNVQLPHVLTDRTGVTGLAISRAIVAGERDPVQLARFRSPRCASRAEAIAQALTGHDQPEPMLALTPA